MKNLRNYAKNVQLVKRNIILCVLLAFIQLLSPPSPCFRIETKGGRERGSAERDTTKRARSDEHNEIYFIKMTMRKEEKTLCRKYGAKRVAIDQQQLFSLKGSGMWKISKIFFHIAPRSQQTNFLQAKMSERFLRRDRDLSDNTARNFHLWREGRRAAEKLCRSATIKN